MSTTKERESDDAIEAFVADPVADPETDCIQCGHLVHLGDVCAETIALDVPACTCSDTDYQRDVRESDDATDFTED